MFADVSFPISSYQTFSYKVPKVLKEQVAIGVRVKVPFGNRKAQGIVVGIQKTTEFKGKISEIESLIDNKPVLNENLWSLIKWLSEYYYTPLGIAAKVVLPANLSTKYKPKNQLFVKAISKEKPLFRRAKAQKAVYDYLVSVNELVSVQSLNVLSSNSTSICKKLATKGLVYLEEKPIIPDLTRLAFNPINKKIRLTRHQNKALGKMTNAMDNNSFKPFLLHGVTGSGKTEIYIEAARHAIKQNKTVILLLPEIALTPQIAGRFKAAFGEDVALWHSKLSQSARAWTWKQICEGIFKVIIGARSAIFAPLKNLGLIIVDEEQESSYKQESIDPRYHARDVALMRGKIHNATVVLASATPSMESYYNQIHGKFNYIHLPERFGQAKYPQVHVVDMMKESEETDIYGGIFSRLLLDRIQDRLDKKEQIILFHNRRGFAPVLRCNDCGEVYMCIHCQIALTYHRDGKYLQCHFCNHTQRTLPSKCDHCQSFNIQLSGTGTQKVEDELKVKFPNAVMARLDADSAKSGVNITKVLQEFSKARINILLGTQMIAKGLDFDNVTLVGIINGDTGLYLPDFRAGERVFQLIYQAAGRSGRGSIPGEVVVQSYSTDNSVIQCATQLNLKKYYNICLDERRTLNYPPFSWMIRMEIRGKNKSAVEQSISDLNQRIKKLPKGVEKLGPAYCYRKKLRDYYRMQVVLKANKEFDQNGSKVHAYYKSIIANNGGLKLPGNLRLVVDVNPVSLL